MLALSCGYFWFYEQLIAAGAHACRLSNDQSINLLCVLAAGDTQGTIVLLSVMPPVSERVGGRFVLRLCCTKLPSSSYEAVLSDTFLRSELTMLVAFWNTKVASLR
eukprot:m.697981 g.697981  ORF g.697981 m.697981 type:complete len:106 (+) comp58683_c0_seq25:242-559(+)